jgi:hypothetical protein
LELLDLLVYYRLHHHLLLLLLKKLNYYLDFLLYMVELFRHHQL